MHPFLHCLIIVALLGGLLQPARAEPTASQAPEAAETQEEALSPYQLKLAVELDDVQAKTGRARLSWEVANWEAEAGLSLTLALPEGLAPARPGALQRGAEAGRWTLPLKYAQGSLALRLESGARLPLEARGELRQKEVLLDSYLAILEGAPTADSLPRVGTGGGKVSGLEGKVTVTFPKGALAEEAGIQIQRVPQQAGAQALGDGQAFEILAAGLVSQKAIHQFGQSILIQAAYEPELVQGNEQSLSLTYFSEEEQDWIPLPGWVDSERHILYARSNHLSVFNYTIHTMDLARLPSLKGYETSLFSGAATYTYPLELPPGPGGLQPSLAMSYNSQVVDGAGESTQASWVGMGWSLETGSITRNMNGTSDTLSDDTYLLNVGGISSQLVPGADGYYHTQEERFWRVQKNTDDTWTVWDKTGMVYSFGTVYPANTFTDLTYDMEPRYPDKSESRLRYETYDWEGCDNSGQVTWAWPLVKAQNKFQSDPNNYLLYTYAYDVKSTQPEPDCDDQQRHFAHAFYPQSIVYPNRRYRVHFWLESRSDYRSSWATIGSRVTFEKRKLNKITLEHDADGNGTYEQTLRTYDLTYTTNASEIIFPGLTWTQGGKTPTLKSIQEYGLNAPATQLPPISFVYGDDMHLTRATNGYGWEVAFVYEAVPYYAANSGASMVIHNDFRSLANPIGLWHGDITFEENLTRYIVRVQGEAYRYFSAASSANHVRPGQVYRISGLISGTGQVGLRAVSAEYPSSLTETWRDLNPDTPANPIGSNNFFILPANANKIEAIVKCANCSLDTFTIERVLTRYRVTAKTVSDAFTSQTSTYTYEYGTPKVNTVNSFNATCPAFDLNLHKECLNEAYGQFLGHASTTEISPSGRKTVTQFHQDANSYKLLGKPKQVEVYDSSNQLLSRQATTYGYTLDQPAANTDASVFPHKAGGPLFSDLKIVWPYTVVEENLVYQAGTANRSGTRVEYNYEKGLQGGTKQYGNPTHVVTSHWDGSQYADDRITVSAYYPKISGGYLTGLPGWTNEYACPNGDLNGACYDSGVDLLYPAETVLSSTISLYDGSYNYASVPSVGVLTGKRTRLRSSDEHYQDTAYAYDTWGNRTRETVYFNEVGLGATSSGAGSTTLTCYGKLASSIAAGQQCAPDGYHTYPAWQVNAAGQFTRWTYDPAVSAPVVEVDVNGAETRAVYDNHGRLTRLCRAGNSACLAGHETQTPSMRVVYPGLPFSAPYTVSLYQQVQGTQVFQLQKKYDGLGNLLETRTVGATVDDVPNQDILVTYGYDSEGRLERQSTPHLASETTLHETLTTYDALNRPLSVSGPDGTPQEYAYGVGGDGRASTTVKGPRRASDDSLIETVKWTDAYGRLKQVIPAEGPGVSYTYDTLGRLTQADYGTAETILEYDSLGNKTAMNDPSMGTWSYSYNAAGQLTQQQDAVGQVTQLTYDALGRLTGKQCAAGGSCVEEAQNVSYQYDGVSWEDEFAGSGLGSDWTATIPAQVSVGNGSVNITGTTSYPAVRLNRSLDNGKAVHFAFKASSTSGAGYLMLETGTFGQSDYRRWALNYNGAALKYSYYKGTANQSDTILSLAAETWYEAELRTGADGVLTAAVWQRGNPTVRADRVLGMAASDWVTGSGRMYTFSASASSGVLALDRVEEREVVESGQRTKMANGASSSVWSYDARGLVTQEVKTIGLQSFTSHWTYNDAGLVREMEYPDGEVVSTDYLPQLVVDSLSGTQTYVSGTQYDAEGRVTQRGLGNGLTSVYEYYEWTLDTNNPGYQQGGRLSTLVTGAFQNLSYRYDPGGNITRIVDSAATPVETLEYSYDLIDRLVSDTTNGGNGYSYDGEGNLWHKGTSTLVYANPANHRVTSTNGGNTYSYDANGNMTLRVIGSTWSRLYYDAENRLGTVKIDDDHDEQTPNLTIAEFTYDGDGRRVKGVVDGVTTLYVNDFYEISAPGGAGATVRKNYAAGGQRIAVRENGMLSYLLSNHLGSTTVTVNSLTLAKTGELRYSSWGETRYSEGTTPTNRRYTGQYEEASLGIYYYGARWYDRALGRFISPDSIVPSTGEGNNSNAVGYVADANYSALVVDYHEKQFLEQLNLENRIRLEDPSVRLPGVPTNPLAFDRYAYSFNNPVRYNDPSGHCPACAVAVLGSLGFTISAPVLIIGGLVVVAGVVAYDTFAPGKEQRHAEIANGLASLQTQTTNGINVLLHKGDWIPPNLNPERRNEFQKAAEKYKEAYSAGNGFQLPKELARKLADLLNSGKSVRDAVDAMPELDEYLEGEDD